MNDEIMKAQRRATQYPYVDGSFEFKIGLTLLILAANTALPPRGVAGIFGLLASVLLISGGGWLIDRLIRLFKESVTFQRSGFVSHPRRKAAASPPDTILLSTVLGFLAWVMLFSWGEEKLGNNLMPIVAALVLFVILLVMAIRTGLLRFYFLAGGSLGIGLVLAFVNHGMWDMQTSGVIFFCLMGVVFLFSGGITLRNYIRNYRPVEDLGGANGQ